MIEQISLLEFLRTGKFGPVQLGMRDKEVADALGDPDGINGSEDAFFFNYGWWEIHFLRNADDKAFLIQNDHLLYDCSNHDEMLEFENGRVKIELDFVKPFQHVRLRHVTEILRKQKIDFKLVDKPYHPILQAASGVYLDFTDTEPFIEKSGGFYWGPGRGQELQEGERRIEESDDLILYTIGITH